MRMRSEYPQKFQGFLNLLAVFLFLFTPLVSFAEQNNGTIDPVAKYAWAETIGWLNFGTVQGNVRVTDAGLTGSVWSENQGWIVLDASPTSRVTVTSEGVLGGYAWSETLGWIDFNGVTIDDDGVFVGYATVLIDESKISLNCKNTNSCTASNFFVATDWRKLRLRTGVVSLAQPDDETDQAQDLIPVPLSPPSTPSDVPTGSSPDEATINGQRLIAFNQMMIGWGSKECGNPSDLNADCSVDILDFNTLMVIWGSTSL